MWALGLALRAEWKVSPTQRYDVVEEEGLLKTSELGRGKEPTLPPWTVTRWLLRTAFKFRQLGCVWMLEMAERTERPSHVHLAAASKPEKNNQQTKKW